MPLLLLILLNWSRRFYEQCHTPKPDLSTRSLPQPWIPRPRQGNDPEYSGVRHPVQVKPSPPGPRVTEGGTYKVQDRRVARLQALEFSVALHTARFKGGDSADSSVRRTASVLFNWLTGPVALLLKIGPVVDQITGRPGKPTAGGSMTQLRDTEQFTLSVDVTDAKGASISDQEGAGDDVTWTVDNGDVATLQVSGDSRSCTVVAGTVGSAVVTVGLGELFATLAIDVIPGDAAVLTISEGPVEPQAV
jgi:hypothetical protein